MTLGNGYTGSELYPKGTHVEPESLVRIAPGALVVGRPLPWTVYDADGKVLLRQGYVIHSESQLEQLFQRAGSGRDGFPGPRTPAPTTLATATPSPNTPASCTAWRGY